MAGWLHGRLGDFKLTGKQHILFLTASKSGRGDSLTCLSINSGESRHKDHLDFDIDSTVIAVRSSDLHSVAVRNIFRLLGLYTKFKQLYTKFDFKLNNCHTKKQDTYSY